MNLTLRHLTLFLWISTVLGLALAFSILPLINGFFPGHDFSVTLVIMVITWGITEFFMNFVGKKLVFSALRSAESWDRAGLARRSQQRYLKALERYDLGLLSPLTAKRVAPVLLASLAKFSLTASLSGPGFEKAVQAFLRISPDHGEIASLWLKRLCREKKLTRQTHEIMTLIAEAHIDHPTITALCAQLFLASGRTDYTARKVYGAVHAGCCNADPEILSGIEAILKSETLSRPLPPAMEATPPSFAFPGSIMDFARVVKIIPGGIKILGAMLAMAVQKTATFLKAGHAFFQRQETLARSLKWGLTLAAVLVLAGLGVSTFFHLIHTPPKETKIEVNRVEVEIPMRFTIQVAAYLKKVHADEYVAKLKQKGLDAYIYRADGGGRTWFIVRVSRFSDRESAAQYGLQLKQQHLIDDFFVDNNE